MCEVCRTVVSKNIEKFPLFVKNPKLIQTQVPNVTNAFHNSLLSCEPRKLTQSQRHPKSRGQMQNQQKKLGISLYAQKKLRFGHINIARSFDKSKVDFWIKKHNFHVLSVVETNFNKKHDKITNPEFIVYEKRRNREGGGIALYVNKILHSEIIEVKTYSTFDSIFVKIFCNDEKTKFKILGSVYCTSIQNPTLLKTCKRNDDIRDLIKQLKILTHKYKNDIHILGDFNAWHEYWGCHSHNARDTSLYNTIVKSSWDVLSSNNPTRLAKRSANQDSFIDFLISTKLKLCTLNTLYPPKINKIDHEALLCKIEWARPLPTITKKQHIWNFKTTCFKQFSQEFLYFFFRSNKPVNMYIELYKFIHTTANKYILKKISNPQTNYYTNNATKDAKGQYNTAFSNYVKSKCQDSQLREIKNKCKSHLRHTTKMSTIGAKRKFISGLSLISNPSKKLKKFKNRLKEKRESIPKLLDQNDNIVTDDKSKCDLLANFFINAVKTLKVKIKDFRRLLNYVKAKIGKLLVSESHISLIIDLIAFYVPKIDAKNKVIYDLKYDLKCTVVDHFPSPTGLIKLLYKVIKCHIKIDSNFKQKMYDINFDEKHKNHVENNVDHILNTEMDRVRSNAPYTTNIDLNIILNARVIPIEIENVIKKLKNSKSPGPDNIFNEFIKNAGININIILSDLLNECISQHIFHLKISNIIPLYKKGKRNLCNNYRPVKLLSIIGKIFERVIANRLQPFLEQSIYNDGQAGFRTKFSTIEQIIYTLEKINIHLSGKNDVIGCFLDISKAFDRIWQKDMLYKLYHHVGIQGNMFLLINNYFNDRYSRIRINSNYSFNFEEDIGVPQGSVLGPIFFLIFINDLLNEISCHKSCFADDLLIFDLSNDRTSQTRAINANLKIIHNWAFKWRVVFDSAKFKLINFTRDRKLCNKNPCVDENGAWCERILNKR